MHPSVSVVIPVHNEAERISGTLASILAQTYPNIAQIIVADGMSTDSTRASVSDFSDSRILLLDNKMMTTPAGLNLAISAATSQIVVRCDGHCVLPPEYVALAIEIMKETGAVNVGGIQNAKGENEIQSSIAMAMSSRLGVGDAKFHYGGPPGPTDTVFLGVFDRAALVEAGLFDEDLIRNQDYELNIRLRQNDGIVYFDPRLAVDYFPRSSYASLARQYFQYGAWKRVVHFRYPNSIRARQLAPPLLVLGLIVSAILAFTKWRYLGVGLPVAYVLSLIATTVLTLSRRRRFASLLMPIAIVTMHLSWGVGYLSSARAGRPARSL